MYFIFSTGGDFLLPVNSGGHAAYQNFVTESLRKYYPDPDSIARSTWDIIERFWNLDLSYTDELLADKYSKFGPCPRTPSCMQRSYLLSIDFKVSSLTEWTAQLIINPLYAILSGFEFGDTPGGGTFYDFLNRLWNSDSNNLSPHEHPVKEKKVKKPKQKGTKADSIEKITVAELLPQLESAEFRLDDQPYTSLFKIYKKKFLDISVSKDLIHKDSLASAGDGTPVVTSHRERKNVSVNVKNKGLLTVNVIVIFLGSIVILAGILPVIVFIMDMIYICLSIPKATFLYFLITPTHQNMIHMFFCMPFLG